MAHRGLLDVHSLPGRYNHRTVYEHKTLLMLTKPPAVDSSITAFRQCLFSKIARAPAVIHFTYPKPWMCVELSPTTSIAQAHRARQPSRLPAASRYHVLAAQPCSSPTASSPFCLKISVRASDSAVWVTPSSVGRHRHEVENNGLGFHTHRATPHSRPRR